MEEEALNLCELLKGCEGEPLYSRAFGEVTMNEIVRDDRPCAYEIKVYTPDPQSDRIWFYRDGRAYRNGQIDLYPSRALYEKYPLDAAKAWAEWAESRKPKRWRAKKYQGYYHLDCIGGRLVTLYDTDEYDKDENNRYESYNYFCTKELAEQAAEEVRKTLQKFHERKEGER